MANPLFGALNQGNMMQILAQLKQNPVSILQMIGLKVPTNINSPADILAYLTQSGQINQAQLNQAQQMAQMFK